MRRWALVLGVLPAAIAGGQQTRSPASECPDSSDTPAILDYAVDQAYLEWRRKPDGPLPPVCLFEAIARAPHAHSDSAVLQTLALSAAALKRVPDDSPNLAARLILLSRAALYLEVGPTFDNLWVVDGSRTTLAACKLAIAAAIRTHDTAGMHKYLGNAATRFPAATQIVAEYRILGQVPRLRALLDTVYRAMKKDRTLIEGYASLASIYGNLNQPDSALAYTRLALARGVKRPIVAGALESLIGVRLRRAQLLSAADVWTETLPLAVSIDSTLSTPASKYLVALSLSEVVADGARLAQSVLFGVIYDVSTGKSMVTVTPGTEARHRVITCGRLVELNAMIDLAREKLKAGGDRFAPETIPTILGGLQKMRTTIALLEPRCPS